METVRLELLKHQRVRAAERRRDRSYFSLFVAVAVAAVIFGYALILGNRSATLETQKMLDDISQDNIRASIAVGSCLRAAATDVESCAVAKFAELNAKPGP